MTDRYLTFRTDAKGRTVIPTAPQTQAGIREDGDVLVCHVKDGRLIVETRTAVRRRLREQAARLPERGGRRPAPGRLGGGPGAGGGAAARARPA